MTPTSSRYELGREIRRDGDTVLVEGYDVRLSRDVALRLPVGEVDADAVRRFVTEARVGAGLQHPGVVPVYELGVGSDGRPFCAGPRVRGRTLTEVLAARPVDLGAARHLSLVAIERLSLTLAYVHAEGIAHGRLSGDGVWVGDHGEVEGEVHVGNLYVSGIVRGRVKTAKRIVIHRGGRLLSDIVTPAPL